MANLPEQSVWAEGIYQIEEENDVMGGPEGTANRQGKQLGDRTRYLKDTLGAEITEREELAETVASQGEDIGEISQQVQAIEGRGGSLDAYDFGSDSPSIEELTRYACENIWGAGGAWTWNADEPWNSTYVIDTVTHIAAEIFSSTWVRNTYNVLYHDQNEADTKMEARFGADGTFTWNADDPPQSTYEVNTETHYLIEIAEPYTLNHKWVLSNTPDTEPRVFSWQNVGQDVVAIANESIAGVVKSGGDVSVNGVTGQMEFNGGVNVPVVSEEPEPVAQRGKLYIYNGRLKIAVLEENEVVRKTIASLKSILPHNEPADLAELLGYSSPNVNDIRDVIEGISGIIRDGRINNFMLGDWIDLPALNVAAGYDSGGAIALDRSMLVDGIPMTRFIVVAKNYMLGKNGNAMPSLAFQARHCLGYSGVSGTDGHYMETTNINTNGYLGCKMRQYLINNMKIGLIAAGIPIDSEYIQAPVRRVSKGNGGGNGYDTIEDKVFLPTEYEMFGTNTYSNSSDEAPAYQGRFEYYDSNAKRVKKTKDGTARVYWEASPYSGSTSTFCGVDSSGAANSYGATNVYGFAPAFCVA
jgi:hypothetical protein